MNKKTVKKKTRKKPEFKEKNANGKNNTKPIVWSEDYVEQELNEMLDNCIKDNSIVYVKELVLYKRYTWNTMMDYVKKYTENQKIFYAYRKIKEICEIRINKGGLDHTYHNGMVKFNLINNYGDDWKESAHIDHTTKGKPIGNKLSDEQLAEIADKLDLDD
jgi:hypothetical protein